MKKIVSIILTVVMLFSVMGLAACSGPGSNEDVKAEAAEETPEAAEETPEEPAEEAETEEAEEPAEEAAADEGTEAVAADEETTQELSELNFDEEAFISEYIDGQGIKEDGTPLKVAIDVSDLSSEFVIYVYEYIQRLMEKAGAEVVANNSNNDLTTQDNNVTDYIAMGVDAVILHAVDSQGSASYVKKLNDAGIPVLCIVKQVDGAKMDFHCPSSDNVETGYKAAEYIAQSLEDAQVAIFQGAMGQSDAYLRQDGIDQVAEEFDNFNIVTENPCEWDAGKAEEMMKDTLTAFPDVNAIILHSDCMDTGIESALKQEKRDIPLGEEGHIMWTGCDGDRIGLEMIKKGLMDWTVEQNPMRVAISSVKVLLTKVAAGEEVGEIIVENPTRAIDQSNVDDPYNWGNYDLDSSDLWVGTQAMWDEIQL